LWLHQVLIQTRKIVRYTPFWFSIAVILTAYDRGALVIGSCRLDPRRLCR